MSTENSASDDEDQEQHKQQSKPLGNKKDPKLSTAKKRAVTKKSKKKSPEPPASKTGTTDDVNSDEESEEQKFRNPKRSEENKEERETCRKLYSPDPKLYAPKQKADQDAIPEEENTQESTWLPYCGAFYTKLQIQTHATKFFHKLGVPAVVGYVTSDAIRIDCLNCKARLLYAKKPSDSQMAKDKKHHEEDSGRRVAWEELQKKVKESKDQNFRLSAPSFQHLPTCSLFISSILERKHEGVLIFDVSPAFYLHKDLLFLAEEYGKEDPYTHSYDQILPMPGKGETDNERYFVSFFVRLRYRTVLGHQYSGVRWA
jgi:hypothetical protein